jgi:hypothetical protein
MVPQPGYVVYWREIYPGYEESGLVTHSTVKSGGNIFNMSPNFTYLIELIHELSVTKV